MLDRVLNSPELEETCDFSDIEEKAQEFLQLPCHLVANDVSSNPQPSIQVDQEKVEGLLDVVNFTMQGPTQERWVCIDSRSIFVAGFYFSAKY